ncbi:Superoxide dismutase [Mn] [Candidatus Rubidus massiliensis]|nr:MAG: superoxide dismutase [Chlamydia sp. 32-24]CDZ79670.1 Superoxide dismutase [Mn] [Candidatus Rubidus massiliensis]
MSHKFELPKLPYNFDALEPFISKEIMELHYTKHHQTYVNNLNKALEQYEEAEKNNDVAAMIALQSAIKFNGGGHVNHSIFWTNLAPVSQGGGKGPNGKLLEAINQQFGSLEKLIETMSTKGTGVQGSGWVWLGYNKSNGRLEVATCDNQDPLSTKGLVPLLGIDVWEHAYYLQYKNVRPDYVKAIWNVVNWANVAERFDKISNKN